MIRFSSRQHQHVDPREHPSRSAAEGATCHAKFNSLHRQPIGRILKDHMGMASSSCRGYVLFCQYISCTRATVPCFSFPLQQFEEHGLSLAHPRSLRRLVIPCNYPRYSQPSKARRTALPTWPTTITNHRQYSRYSPGVFLAQVHSVLENIRSHSFSSRGSFY